MVRRVDVSGPTNRFKDFFKIDEYQVSLEDRVGGKMGAAQKRLVFERGDSVAALLLNLDSRNVVLVRQFKVPALVGRRRDDGSTTDGWITETVAGMIDGNETPEHAIVRETMEEVGYRIANPKLIGTFFSSPGGTSERIFLYFAEVREADKHGKGGGLADEDIEVVEMSPQALFRDLKAGKLEDPKLIAAACWLQDYFKSGEPLASGTVEYAVKKNSGGTVGYKTGNIEHVEDVTLWVNSENQDMLMDRFIGKTISANIRRLGANTSKDGAVIEDTIHESLRTAVGRRQRVEIGTVLDTVSGALLTSNGVKRILHVATVRARGDGGGVAADPEDIKSCLNRVLIRAEERNRWLLSRLWKTEHKSILVPMLGAGDGGLAVEDVARMLIPVAVRFLQDRPKSILKQIFFLAYTSRDKAACDRILEQLERDGQLERVGR